MKEWSDSGTAVGLYTKKPLAQPQIQRHLKQLDLVTSGTRLSLTECGMQLAREKDRVGCLRGAASCGCDGTHCVFR